MTGITDIIMKFFRCALTVITYPNFLSNILQHFSWIAVVLGRYFQNIQNQASRFFSAQDLEYRDLLKSLQNIVYHIAASMIGHEFTLLNAFGLTGSIFCGGDPGAGQL